MGIIQNHLLSFIVLLPAMVALIIIATPWLRSARVIALVGSLIGFSASIYLWETFDPNIVGPQFVEAYDWMPHYGVKYFIGVDGLSLLLVMLTNLLLPLIVLYLWNNDRRPKFFLAMFLLLQTAILGAFLAFDFVLFYIFWEAMLIPIYFIIGIWGGPRRIHATTKLFIYTAFGSLLMLVAGIVLYQFHLDEFSQPSASLFDLYKTSVPFPLQHWLFLAFAVSFAIRAPVWPFHSWLPDAHVEAPTAGSVILAAVLLKMGAYGFLRFAIPLFPQSASLFAPYIVALGLVGIVYGALVTWAQDDAKKLVAYSSISHLGFIVIGLLSMSRTTNISKEALTGSIYQMITHGAAVAALFFLIGVIYERRRTRLLTDFGGLANVMPWFAVLFAVITFSAVGVPGSGGFIGEFLILLGTFKSSYVFGSTALLGGILGAVYMLDLYRRIFFGPLEKEENKHLADLSKREAAVITPLVILVIAMGIFPNYFLDKVRNSIEYFSDHYAHYSLQTVSDNQNIDSIRSSAKRFLAQSETTEEKSN